MEYGSMIKKDDMITWQVDLLIDGLPSNEHYLNNLLGETNILFSKLMEIEDLCEE